MWNFPRILSAKSMGKKRRKEPNTGGTAQEEKPAGRERREEKKNCCPSQHSIIYIFQGSMLKHQKSNFLSNINLS